jgi:hypothetical protein
MNLWLIWARFGCGGCLLYFFVVLVFGAAVGYVYQVVAGLF